MSTALGGGLGAADSARQEDGEKGSAPEKVGVGRCRNEDRLRDELTDARAQIAALESENAQHVNAIECLRQESGRYRDALVMFSAMPPEITRGAVRSVAYDVVFNLIPKDVAECQLVQRSKREMNKTDDDGLYDDYCPSDLRGPGRPGQ